MVQDEHNSVRSSGICTSPISFFETSLQPIEHTNYILVTGPGISIQPHLEKDDSDQKSSYWNRFLTGVTAWCLQNYGIEQRNIKEEFLPLFIEEYLVEKSEQQRCLRDVLPHVTQSTDFHLLLASMPCRGYISTTYDTLLETAYERVNYRPLPKFYASSIQDAVETYQRGRPFILKPYGDIDDPVSLIVDHRWRKGPSIMSKQTLLRSLLTYSPILFFGFEDNDPDLKYFRSVVENYSPLDQIIISYPITPGKQQDQRYNSLSMNEGSFQEPSLTLSALVNTTVPEELAEDSPPQVPQATAHELREEQEVSSDTDFDIPIEVYTAYAYQDEQYYQDIEGLLETINMQGGKISCHQSEVSRSVTWEGTDYLTTAHLILLLVSRDFLRSRFCYCPDMIKAVEEKHGNGVFVVPIIVRPAPRQLEGAPFGSLDSLPTDREAISRYYDRGQKEEVLDTIFDGIVEKLEKLKPYIQYN